VDAGFAHTSTSQLVRHAMVGHPWRVRLGSFDDFGSVWRLREPNLHSPDGDLRC
jgi:hypothetical protein